MQARRSPGAETQMRAVLQNGGNENEAKELGSPGSAVAEFSIVKPGRSRGAKLLIRISCAMSILLCLYVFRAPILVSLAECWIVTEPLVKADAIVVLGGGIERRPFEAARLYREGSASRILLMETKPNPSEELGITVPETERSKQILERLGVPEGAIHLVGHNVSSTFEEASAVCDW